MCNFFIEIEIKSGFLPTFVPVKVNKQQQ